MKLRRKNAATISGMYEGNNELSRSVASEGTILLENSGILPLKSGAGLTLFGKTKEYIKGGGGSADVNSPYTVSIFDGLKKKESVELFSKVLAEDFSVSADDLRKAKEFSNICVVVFTRQSEEGSLQDADRKINEYYMTDNELGLIEQLEKKGFDIIVIFNVCGLVDFTWTERFKSIKAVLLVWQGGMEGGNSVADILAGDNYPSGRLPDTAARNYSDYPSASIGDFGNSGSLFYREDIFLGYRYFEFSEKLKEKVKYPFGYGLNYTEFEVSDVEFYIKNNIATIEASVKNIGSFSGKEVLQVYFSAPSDKLPQPAKVLIAFAKTHELMPQESEALKICFEITDTASYDDTGKTQAKSSYIMEKGEYKIYLGTNVRNAQKIGSFIQSELKIVRQVTKKLVPVEAFDRLINPEIGETEKVFKEKSTAKAPVVTVRSKRVHKKCTLKDVKNGKITLENFVRTLSERELAYLSSGHKSRQFKGGIAAGGTGILGGLDKRCIPALETSDGPAGLRNKYITATSWPCATLLASTWNTELLEKVGEASGKEMKKNGCDLWLAPALNLHRNPLCSRNFEYYSEDPLLSGKIASSITRGVQKQNVGVTIKHFAGNNQQNYRVDTGKNASNSVASERAWREIYLKGFEIAVRESAPWAVMAAYNKLNGTLCAERYDLITGILKEEWGFSGIVMTDWEFCGANSKNAAAGIVVKMPRGNKRDIFKALRKGELSRAQLERNAEAFCRLALKK